MMRRFDNYAVLKERGMTASSGLGMSNSPRSET